VRRRSKSLGDRGEAVARKALEARGYRILAANYRCPLGEVDIVARTGRQLVFVEVKSEEGRGDIPPKCRVDRRKQRKLRDVARYFLKERRLEGISARFDVVEVRLEEGERPVVEILPNAFEIEAE